jgi:nucleoside-diphosphate-sugar epimerase
MKILFIGGTGNISTACTQLAAQRGIDLYLFNRGERTVDIPEGVQIIRGDINQPEEAAVLLQDHHFDAVVNWIVYDVDQMERDIRLFSGKTDQYVFISTASAYQKPATHYRITEATPLANPYSEYARKKIACEERLIRQYREEGFPITIVRPSHTYGPVMLPAAVGGGPTVLARLRAGKKLIVHGDGESLWVLTHNSDFAKAFVGLLAHPNAIGQVFQITSDEVLTWNQIYRHMGQAAGVEPRLVHIPSDFINHHDPVTGASLLGDKAYSVIFDNSKIKELVPDYTATVPFSQGVHECIAWLDADPERGAPDPEKDATMDRIITAYERAWV